MSPAGGDNDDDDGVDLLVPSSFAVTLPRADDDAAGSGRAVLRAHTFAALRHKHVVVIANGFTYRGVFVGADEDDVYLRGTFRWFVLPLSSVTTLRKDLDVVDDDDDDDDDASAGDADR